MIQAGDGAPEDIKIYDSVDKKAISTSTYIPQGSLDTYVSTTGRESTNLVSNASYEP
jgi:hypothetical protein